MTSPAEALRAAGITVHDARVDPRPGLWSPVGVLLHHTGTGNPPALGAPASLRVCQDGRADLEGPLCQWLVGGDGAWWWVTEGRANHAGKGDKDVWAWVSSDDPARSVDPPAPDDNNDTTDGNSHMVGVEVEGSGYWTADVLRSVRVGTKALLAHYGLRVDTAIGHKEWTALKPDPAGENMAQIRVWLRNAGHAQPDPHGGLPEMFIYTIQGNGARMFFTGTAVIDAADDNFASELKASGVRDVGMRNAAFHNYCVDVAEGQHRAGRV